MNGLLRAFQKARNRPAPYRFGDNPNYLESVKLGFQHGIWSLPAEILLSSGYSLLAGIGMLVLTPLMLLSSTIAAVVVTLIGIAGKLTPPAE